MQPRLLGHTNNIVLRLDPHPVVAKVGLWPHSAEVLRREYDVAELLAIEGAPTARPLRGGGWHLDADSGLPVTLWDLLDAQPVGSPGPSPLELADSLRALHDALRVVAARLVLPSFLWAMDLAAEKLADDEAMGMMTAPDLAFLRAVHPSLRRQAGEVASASDAGHALHGEPHGANVVATGAGPRWIDFEAACTGPLEYDLASAGPEVAAA
ncbi:MAG: aminoglycoside phosphotransferase family protein, partial [Actinomycetota bacterium]|nr:aminoglycoside phosphotransferase family protein [Actinomycetota bacterium]